MTREELIQSAMKLKQPLKEIAEEYASKRDALAAEINRRMTAREDLVMLLGEGNQTMMEDNHRNHARFMESVFLGYNPVILVDTVLWVFRAYRSHGFRLAYWPAQLDTWVEILKQELSPTAFEQIYPFYNWMIINQPAFVSLTDDEIQNNPN